MTTVPERPRRFTLPVWPRVIVAAFIALVVVAPIAAPMLTGIRWIVVDGGSMEPTFRYGDIVMVAPLGSPAPSVGEVVTVRRADDRLYTHRIVRASGDGSFVTRGDANTFEDRDPVTVGEILGRVVGVLTGPPAVLVRASGSLPLRVLLAGVVLALFLVPVSPRRRAGSSKVRGAMDEPKPATGAARR